ncbi:hypothetical protein N181_01990 [Sinorhizobium fredii USDA 205]|nr:hypothetical protein N181_01990 [Sinorhizobium fredii USDA 205]
MTASLSGAPAPSITRPVTVMRSPSVSSLTITDPRSRSKTPEMPPKFGVRPM